MVTGDSFRTYSSLWPNVLTAVHLCLDSGQRLIPGWWRFYHATDAKMKNKYINIISILYIYTVYVPYVEDTDVDVKRVCGARGWRRCRCAVNRETWSPQQNYQVTSCLCMLHFWKHICPHFILLTLLETMTQSHTLDSKCKVLLTLPVSNMRNRCSFFLNTADPRADNLLPVYKWPVSVNGQVMHVYNWVRMETLFLFWGAAA